MNYYRALNVISYGSLIGMAALFALIIFATPAPAAEWNPPTEITVPACDPAHEVAGKAINTAREFGGQVWEMSDWAAQAWLDALNERAGAEPVAGVSGAYSYLSRDGAAAVVVMVAGCARWFAAMNVDQYTTLADEVPDEDPNPRAKPQSLQEHPVCDKRVERPCLSYLAPI